MPKSSYRSGKVDNLCNVELVPRKKLRSFFVDCISMLHQEKGVNIGDYLEFGVFNGSSMTAIYDALGHYKKLHMRLFGFDSFQGLPAGVEETNHNAFHAGDYKCSFEKMQYCMRKRGIDPDKITWIPGWYDETLNQKTIAQYGFNNLGIVFIDCDSYEASKLVLDFIAPLIKQPVIIVLDDWGLGDLDLKQGGEYRSFNEFVEGNPHLKVSKLSMSYSPKARTFLVKPRFTNFIKG